MMTDEPTDEVRAYLNQVDSDLLTRIDELAADGVQLKLLRTKVGQFDEDGIKVDGWTAYLIGNGHRFNAEGYDETEAVRAVVDNYDAELADGRKAADAEARRLRPWEFRDEDPET